MLVFFPLLSSRKIEHRWSFNFQLYMFLLTWIISILFVLLLCYIISQKWLKLWAFASSAFSENPTLKKAGKIFLIKKNIYVCVYGYQSQQILRITSDTQKHGQQVLISHTFCWYTINSLGCHKFTIISWPVKPIDAIDAIFSIVIAFVTVYFLQYLFTGNV